MMNRIRHWILAALPLLLVGTAHAENLLPSLARVADATVTMVNGAGLCSALITVDVTAVADSEPGTGEVTLRHQVLDPTSGNAIDIVRFTPFFRIGTYSYYIGGPHPIPQNFQLLFDTNDSSSVTYSADLSWLPNCVDRGSAGWQEVLLPSGARGADFSLDIYNSYGHCALILFVDVTADSIDSTFAPTTRLSNPLDDAVQNLDPMVLFDGMGNFIYYIGATTSTGITDNSKFPPPYHFVLLLDHALTGTLTFSVSGQWVTECGL